MRERRERSATRDAALATSDLLPRIFLFLVPGRNIALCSTWSVLARDEILSRKILVSDQSWLFAHASKLHLGEYFRAQYFRVTNTLYVAEYLFHDCRVLCIQNKDSIRENPQCVCSNGDIRSLYLNKKTDQKSSIKGESQIKRAEYCFPEEYRLSKKEMRRKIYFSNF